MSGSTIAQLSFAEALKNSISSLTAGAEPPASLQPLLLQLIDALPGYRDANFLSVHRAAIINLLEIHFPNDTIVPTPGENSDWGQVVTTYSYAGPYSGYQNAFFGQVPYGAAAAAIEAALLNLPGAEGLSAQWWGRFGVTALTDAVRIAGAASVDGGKVASDLNTVGTALLPWLACSYVAVLKSGYPATAMPLSLIAQSSQGANAIAVLAKAITQGQFTANINEAISVGGASTDGATWFLFNLWVTFAALGETDVNQRISDAMNAGLTVPEEVGPSAGSQGWWAGGYTNWFLPIAGNDLSPQASTTISADFPQNQTIFASAVGLGGGGAGGSNTLLMTTNQGYSKSLCNWGSLNWYSD